MLQSDTCGVAANQEIVQDHQFWSSKARIGFQRKLSLDLFEIIQILKLK